jgi:MFS family permease
VLLAQRVADTALAGLPQTLLVVGTAAATLALSRATLRWGRMPALSAGQSLATTGAAVGVMAALRGSLLLVLISSTLIGAGQAAVMLARYAAADLAEPRDRSRAMGRLLGAVTVGAVIGPNLLAPTDSLGRILGQPSLAGPYAVAALTFALAAACLAERAGSSAQPAPGHDGAASWSAQGLTGLAVLSVANLIMIAVMTMAPLYLRQLGSGLAAVGLVVSVHIAGMFLPSPISASATARFGAARTSVLAAVLLGLACAWAMTARSTPPWQARCSCSVRDGMSHSSPAARSSPPASPRLCVPAAKAGATRAWASPPRVAGSPLAR